MSNSFFAMLSRMKYIHRWPLMRNTSTENISEHTQEVAVLAHALALLHNTRFEGNADVGKCVLLALYHDVPEIITGDLPTPVKYHSEVLRDAYRQVEDGAADRLLAMLPDDLQGAYYPLLHQESNSLEARLVKAADKLSALIKYTEELKLGNREFFKAHQSTEQSLHAMKLPAVEVFLKEFMPAYGLTLDEQQGM